jgi:cystathionine beta-lyase/cystathionine gamma-synthase
MKELSVETLAVHAGEPRKKICGSVNLPIFQSATYLYTGESTYEDLKYIRLNNTPNHLALSQKLAALEEGESAIVAASGMAAISDSLLAFLESGDHIIAQNCIYGGTRDLITREFPKYGIEVDFLEELSPENLERHIKPRTRVLLVESITNPLLQVENLVATADFARCKGLISLIDNTFASPVNFKPIRYGFDLVLHSCTKYLNGHSDLVAGAVIGKSEYIKAINHRNLHYGGALDPHTCFLLQRGIKTLPLRMKQHNRNGAALAEFLSGHPGVSRVHYPGLPGSGGNEETKKLFSGFSGMLSMELKGTPNLARRFMEKLELPVEAPSLGGVESLMSRPCVTSHSGLTQAERDKMGISDTLIRISAGVEGTDDLIADFKQALQ